MRKKVSFGPPEGYDGSYRAIKRGGIVIGSLLRVSQDVWRKYRVEILNPYTSKRVSFYRPTLDESRAVAQEYTDMHFRPRKEALQ